MRSVGSVRWLELGILLGGTILSMPLAAQEAPIAFRIPAGDLDQALRTYARVTGRQILFRPQDVRDRRFAGLLATLDRDTALATILRDTGLRIDRPSTNVIVLRGPLAGDADPEPTSTPAEATAEVVVTGSNIRGGEAGGPVRVLTRRDLERSGKATVADLIAAQTSNFGGAGNPVAALSGVDQSSLNYSVAPAANLRGLGPDATLTLFDGRRVAGSGGRGDFSDLSAIPSLAVDRVEILTDGASAIYGSDAVAGVVNLILRHRFDGLDVRLRGGIGTRGEPWSALGALAAGKSWSTGAIVAAYDYEHRGRLSSADRAYTATSDLRSYGGSDRRTIYSVPGNILTFSPALGTLVPTFAIPASSRQPTVADVVPGRNFGNLYEQSDLSPRIDRHAAYARIEQNAGEHVGLFLEGRYAHRRFGYVSPASVTVLTVTPANPFFIPVGGQSSSLIGYSFLNDLGPARVDGRVSALSLTGGLNWQLGSWRIDGYGTFARERSSDLSSNQINSTALAEALGNVSDNPATGYSPSRDGFFNPYGSGTSNSPATLAFIGSGFARSLRRSSLAEGSAKAEGPLFSLPGGDVRLAVGGSYRRESFRRDGESFYSGVAPTSTPGIPGHRGITAAFTEMQLPLFGEPNARAGLRKLNLTAAVRHEDYADFGTTTNPKLGVVYSPARDLMLRASYGTSFRAPALPEVNDPVRVIGTALPNAAGITIPVLFLTGGNTALGPETARSFSAGAVLEPGGIKGLRIEATFFRTRFDDRIAQPALDDFTRALSNPALTSFIRFVRPATSADDLATVTALLSAPGTVAGTTPATAYGAVVDGRFVNTSSLTVSGLDWDANLSLPLAAGRIDAGLSATWLFEYRQRLTPQSTSIDRLDTLGNPVNLKLRGSAGWAQGPWSATLIGNYVDGYRDDISVPARKIASFFTLDATLGIAPTSGLLKGLQLSLAIENLLDRDPPFANRVNGFGFDAASASPFGRLVALELRRSW